MILNVQHFVETEQKHWQRLESMLDRLERDASYQMDLRELQQFYALYRRATADLAKISTFASEQTVRQYLETLVARAYGEIHEIRAKPHFQPLKWFFQIFPRTFRRHIRVFWLSLAITCAGVIFGGLAISFDVSAKEILIGPFSHLSGDPGKRVAEEESGSEDRLAGRKAHFSTQLMTHNTEVSILILAMGMTWGVGSAMLLFYNGVILGAVALDYILAGQTKFLLGWLMPHGVVEIPSFIIAGQAGLLLGGALIGWGSRTPLRGRLRAISSDLTTLICGVAIMLVWAGFMEAFLSQYHEPVIPYGVKIGLGGVELVVLILFLTTSGFNKGADGASTVSAS